MKALAVCIGLLAALGFMAFGIFLSWETAQIAKKTITIFNCSVVYASKVQVDFGEYGQYYYREVTVIINNQNYTDPLAYCPDEACDYFNKTAYCLWDNSGSIIVNYDLARAQYYLSYMGSNRIAILIVIIIAAFLSSTALFVYFGMKIPEECRKHLQFFRNNQYQELN